MLADPLYAMDVYIVMHKHYKATNDSFFTLGINFTNILNILYSFMFYIVFSICLLMFVSQISFKDISF